jgi:hypothetical protein
MTPRFALARLRASLITLPSIRYMRGALGRVDPLEVRVDADVRHCRQDLGEAAPTRARERRRQDCAMFRFRAPAMRPGALLERPGDLVIDSADQQIGHIPAPRTGDINDSIDITRGKSGRVSAPGRPGDQRVNLEGGTKRGPK